jgi:hypothetical protein
MSNERDELQGNGDELVGGRNIDVAHVVEV